MPQRWRFPAASEPALAAIATAVLLVGGGWARQTEVNPLRPVAIDVAESSWHSDPVEPPPTTIAEPPVTPITQGQPWRPAVGESWQWQLTGTPDVSESVDVYDLDLFGTDASTVSSIHASGARAICHLETGVWDNSSPDAAGYPGTVLGATVGGYSDQRYVDVRNVSVLRPLIDARLDQCKAKGFDGVEPDGDDTVFDVGASGIGFAASYADQIAFDRVVADDAHARGLAVGLKDGTFGTDIRQFVTDLEPVTDFAVNQECVASGDACGALATFISHGKPVFHAEYLADYAGATAADPAPALAFCRSAAVSGFSSIVKASSAEISAWRVACPVS